MRKVVCFRTYLVNILRPYLSHCLCGRAVGEQTWVCFAWACLGWDSTFSRPIRLLRLWYFNLRRLKLCPSKKFDIEKCWSFLPLFFGIWLRDRNFLCLRLFLCFKKSWDLKDCLYLCFLLHKISKNQGKNNRVPTFFYVFLKKT